METYLAHHGILGMKWGVRRYQNKDGTLTEAGKARAMKVDSSSFRSWRDTKAAKSILNDNIRRNSAIADTFNRAKDKASEDVEKYDKIGDAIRGRKARDDLAKYTKIAENAINKNREYSSTLMGIDDKTIKAGRDFFIQRDWNYNVFWLTREERLILPNSANSGAMRVKDNEE